MTIKSKVKNTSANKSEGFTIDELLDLSRTINKKAQSDGDYKKVIDVANEKWESGCGYEFK